MISRRPLALAVTAVVCTAACAPRNVRLEPVTLATSNGSRVSWYEARIDSEPETVGNLRRRAVCNDATIIADDIGSRGSSRSPIDAICAAWRDVRSVRNDAWLNRDVVRLRCADSRLEDANELLDRAIELRGELDRATLAFEVRRKMVLLDRLASDSFRVAAEANECVGESSVAVGMR